MKHLFSLTALLLLATAGFAQKGPENSDARMYLPQYGVMQRSIIHLPNLDGYVTLKGDFHSHTMFADAHVSPEGRIKEAWCDGLDVICVSEHIGVHKSPGIKRFDHNLVTKRAVDAGKQYDMIVIPGVEITREKPFGHFCCLFLSDCNVFAEERYKWDENGDEIRDANGKRIPMRETEIPDFLAAEKQGAFIQWNHPGWPDNYCQLPDFHKKMIQEKRIHAVEVFNTYEWYPKVLDWMDEYHITVTANSDSHNPIRVDYGNQLRPMNLIFAKEATLESVKEAMFAGRMLALWNNNLTGKEELMRPFVSKCLQVKPISGSSVEVINTSDITYTILYGSHTSPIELQAGKAQILKIKKGEMLKFTNCLIGRKNLEMALY